MNTTFIPKPITDNPGRLCEPAMHLHRPGRGVTTAKFRHAFSFAFL